MQCEALGATGPSLMVWEVFTYILCKIMIQVSNNFNNNINVTQINIKLELHFSWMKLDNI